MAEFTGLRAPDRRILVVTGHYGSGKTEFCVSLALRLAEKGFGPYGRLALVDLDIANPYFRSRERKQLLEAAGVRVYGNAYAHEITAELPALGADIRAPLEDADCRVIVDVGGNDSGALVLNQFMGYLGPEDALFLTVVNANRPETRDLEGALAHIEAIQNRAADGRRDQQLPSAASNRRRLRGEGPPAVRGDLRGHRPLHLVRHLSRRRRAGVGGRREI